MVYRLDGGIVVGPEEEGQTLGLLLYDRNEPPLDGKGWPLYALRLTDERPACGSPKSRGGYCESPYRYHNGRCKKHGGNAARGPAHGNWQHGQRSRYVSMPRGIRAHFEHAVTDPELTHHRASVALVDELIDELLESYDFGANPERWAQVKRLVRKVETHNNAGDRVRAREAFEELKLVTGEGSDHAQQSATIVRLLEARRRHADSETKRKLSESLVFDYATATAYYLGMGQLARKHFGHDQERLTAFLTDITSLSGEHGVGGSAGAIDAAERGADPARNR